MSAGLEVPFGCANHTSIAHLGFLSRTGIPLYLFVFPDHHMGAVLSAFGLGQGCVRPCTGCFNFISDDNLL